MSRRKSILIGALLYGIFTLFLFIRNVVMAKEQVTFEEIVAKEEIVDEESRATLRAFYTAPPVIPHAVESRDSKDCLRCHRVVTKLEDGRVAQKTPHPHFSSCLQCHVPGLMKEDVDTTWQGLKEPERGDRWFWVSPPTVPHRIFLRENCLSCHGPENPNMKLRTTHPERTSCLQCHVPNYKQEF